MLTWQELLLNILRYSSIDNFPYLTSIIRTWWFQKAITVNTACTCIYNSLSAYLSDWAGSRLWQRVCHTSAQLLNPLVFSGGSFHFVFCNTYPVVEGKEDCTKYLNFTFTFWIVMLFWFRVGRFSSSYVLLSTRLITVSRNNTTEHTSHSSCHS